MRLNELTKKELHLGIAMPGDLSVLMRANFTKYLHGKEEEIKGDAQFRKFLKKVNPSNDQELTTEILRSLKIPVAVMPTLFEQIIGAQDSAFTIHSGKSNCKKDQGEEELSLEKLCNVSILEETRKKMGIKSNSMPILLKIKIAGNKKYAIKKDLVENFGVNERSLFLDRRSHARDIHQKWQFFVPSKQTDIQSKESQDYKPTKLSS